MTDRDDLLAAICAHPDEDTPRLAYADWLDEHAGTISCPKCKGHGHFNKGNGDYNLCHEEPGGISCDGSGTVPDGNAARAEFIRVQVELASTKREGHRTRADVTAERRNAVMGGCCDRFADNKACDCLSSVNPEYEALRQRERELWTSLGPGLIADVRRLVRDPMFWQVTIGELSIAHNGDRGFVYRRGFVAEVRCSAADWLACADALYWHPSQTVACPEHGSYWHRTKHPCAACDGTGHIPRPFVPTAQPIVRVILTAGAFDDRIRPLADKHKFSFPPAGYFGDDAEMRMITRIFEAEWPHVEFALPPA